MIKKKTATPEFTRSILSSEKSLKVSSSSIEFQLNMKTG